MAVASQNLDLVSGLTIVRDTDADGTSESNINTGAGILHLVRLDNTANASQAVFLKLYNNTGPTIGTTVPDVVLRAAGGAVVQMAIMQGGVSFGTGISFACVTAGGTGGTTSPTSDVVVALTIE